MGRPSQDTASSSSPSGSSRSSKRGPRLDCRNASKNIGYEYDPAKLFCSYPPSPSRASSASASASAAPSLASSAACSVDLSSFRIGGSGDGGGDVQLLCRNLGLSGPEDFAISLTDWEAHKAFRSSASSSPSARSQPDRPVRESPLRHEAAEEPTLPVAADFELPAKETARDAPVEAPVRPAWLDRSREQRTAVYFPT